MASTRDGVPRRDVANEAAARGRPTSGAGPVVAVLAVLAAVWVLYPLGSLAVATPWARIPTLLVDPANRTALWLSLATSACSCVTATVLGTALAVALARRSGWFALLVRVLVLVPLVLPPVVSGLTLMMAYGRQSLLAPVLEAANVRIVFTPLAVVAAQVFVALPFVVLTLEGAIRERGFAPELAAASLGARPARVFRTVTLPRFAPLIALAATLAFARSLGEFGATLTFAGSLEGSTRTLPLQIYLLRETDPASAVGMSMIMVLTSLVVVFLAYARMGQGRSGS